MMARTHRRTPTNWLRHPKTTNTRRGEHCTVLDMLENEINVRNRFRARGNLTSCKIPTAWDDIQSSNPGHEVKWRLRRRHQHM